MTSPIALSKDEPSEFTPPSLANVVPTPVFRFRPATFRDQRRFNHLLAVEGLRLYPDENIRAELLRVLKANWSEETFEKERARLETLWANLDQELPVDEDERSAMAELSLRAMDVSPLLRRMSADNQKFQQEAPGIALSMFLAGWKHVPTPFKLDGGIVAAETIAQLEGDILAIEEQAVADGVADVSPSAGFLQLAVHALSLLNLGGETRKNSSAPSPSSDSPNGIQTTSREDGASSPQTESSSTSRPTATRRGSSRGKSRTSSTSGSAAGTGGETSPGQTAAASSTSHSS